MTNKRSVSTNINQSQASSASGEEGQGRRCEETVYHSSMVIVLLSKNLITWLNKTRIMLGKLLHPSRVLGLYINITASDITPALANLLQTLPCWRSVDINNSSDDKADYLIDKYSEEILNNQEKLSTRPPEDKFQVFPKKLSLTQPKIMIILDESVDPIDREQFLVVITQADTSFSIEDAKWIKDDIVQVEIPKLLFQSTRLVSLSLIIGDTNYGVRKLKLENTAAVMEQCWSSSQDPVSMFSEALSTRFLSISDVDEYLSASVERKMNLSDLLCSTTTGCHRDQNNVCRCEDQDHSNLLHWSAGHGLTRLSETLIKTGFTRYINLPNIQGLTPLDLAERHGDTGLVRMLKNHLLNLTLSSHQYPVTRPRSNTLLEDADGYLIPHTLEDIVSGHRTVEDTGPGHRLKQRHVSLSSAEEFYQRPPTPRPLTVSVCSIATGTTASITSGSPPGASITSSTSSSSSTKCRSAGYIKMVSAPLKKAMSEPRSEAECFIPKSGSFSHFTMTNKKPGSALSREELIAKYCRDTDDPHTRDDTSPATSVHDDSRPESTPPDLGSHHHSDNISIPHHHHHDTQDSDSSPLDHYVHTDPHLDGKIIISYLLVSLTIFVLKSYPLIIVL